MAQTLAVFMNLDFSKVRALRSRPTVPALSERTFRPRAREVYAHGRASFFFFFFSEFIFGVNFLT